MVAVEFMKDGKKQTFAMDNRIYKYIQMLKELVQKKDYDAVFLVDGAEGSGKSVFAMQLGMAIDDTFCIERVCFNPDDFVKCVQNANKGQVIVYDEAYTGLSARQSLSEINKLIVSMMMEMRQKNLIVIIVLPTFFMLDRYVGIFRSKCLFHIYTNKGRRGYFLFYNSKQKKILYLLGKKLMSYNKPRVKLKGHFNGKYVLDEERYREMKDYALKHREKEKTQSRDAKREFFEGKSLVILHDVQGYTFPKIAELYSTPEHPIGVEAIRKRYHKAREMMNKAVTSVTSPY